MKTMLSRKRYCSISQFERDFFPKAYEKDTLKKQKMSQTAGTGLVIDLLEGIRVQLKR
jgi:hypothetical protein